MLQSKRFAVGNTTCCSKHTHLLQRALQQARLCDAMDDKFQLKAAAAAISVAVAFADAVAVYKSLLLLLSTLLNNHCSCCLHYMTIIAVVLIAGQVPEHGRAAGAITVAFAVAVAVAIHANIAVAITVTGAGAVAVAVHNPF